jgi:tRNA 2-thiouridine synthesizing protein E
MEKGLPIGHGRLSRIVAGSGTFLRPIAWRAAVAVSSYDFIAILIHMRTKIVGEKNKELCRSVYRNVMEGNAMPTQATDPVFNSEGYLADFSAWDRDFAIGLAKQHNVELTECHWHVLNFMREYYSTYEIAPDPREVIKKLSKQISPTTPCTRKHLDGMFGEGGCKLACKIAGLPTCYCRV